MTDAERIAALTKAADHWTEEASWARDAGLSWRDDEALADLLRAAGYALTASVNGISQERVEGRMRGAIDGYLAAFNGSGDD